MSQPLTLAVLISGGGTTLKNLLEQIRSGRLAATMRLVVSSNRHAKGLDFARQAGIATQVTRRRDCASPEEFRDQIFGACRAAEVELVVMGGFLKHVLIPEDFAGRVINIHPSLIPAFCGHGFYGRRVHQAVLEQGARVSGCTVHFVDDEYDHGPIILQEVVPVLDDDTPESLAQRVSIRECAMLPEAIRRFAAGEFDR